MQELISPQQSETFVLIIAGVLTVGGAAYGFRVHGTRGVLVGLVGPLVFGLWQFHKWITRYDPQTGYFGLDKVKVLLLEVVLFIVLGAVLGITYQKLIHREGREAREEIEGMNL